MTFGKYTFRCLLLHMLSNWCINNDLTHLEMKEAHEMNKCSFNVSKQVGEDLLLLFIIYTLVFL